MVANGEFTYPLVFEHSYRKSPFLIGKPSINGPFSIAMLVYQRVRTTHRNFPGKHLRCLKSKVEMNLKGALEF